MDAELDLRALFSFLRRQLRLILVVLLTVVGITAGIVFTITPNYTAETLVMVDPSNRNLLLPDTQLGPTTAAEARIGGEVLLAQSDNVLLTVVDRENLLESEEFRPELGFTARILSFLRLQEPTLPTPDQALRQTLNRLAAMTSVQRQGSTYLISISVRSENPERAASLANAVARAYIDTQLLAKVQSTNDARDVLLQQIDAARQGVIDSDGSFDRYIDQNLGSIIQQTGNSELASIRDEINQLSSTRQTAATEVATLQTRLSQQDFTALANRLADEAITSLEAQRQNILGQIESGTSIAEVDLREQLARIETQLEAETATRISSLQANLQEAQSDEATLRQNLRTAILSSGLSPDTLTEIYDLQQQAELARQQYDQLLTRSQQLQAEATLQLPDSRVVSPALRPSSPSSPNTRLILAVAALAGFGLGIGLAFLYEHFIGGVVSEEQLALLAKTKLSFGVPRMKPQGDQASVADLVMTSPLASFSEAIRRIRTAIDQGLPTRADEKLAPVIMITSTEAAEGKTTTALSLARSFAQTNRRTLVIDCDFRRPSLHRHVDMQVTDDLVDALRSDNPTEKLQNAIVQDRQPNLFVLLNSRHSEVATDQLLVSQNFDRLVAAARRSFDVVVLDTPPLGPVVDGQYLAKKADAIVMVVQWASTSQQSVRRSFLTLDGAINDGTIFVPVLNQQDQKAGYYGRYSSYYTAA
jgi:polysaccharide biosynthesis transport protein